MTDLVKIEGLSEDRDRGRLREETEEFTGCTSVRADSSREVDASIVRGTRTRSARSQSVAIVCGRGGRRTADRHRKFGVGIQVKENSCTGRIAQSTDAEADL